MEKNIILTQIDKDELALIIQNAIKNALVKPPSSTNGQEDILSLKQACQLLGLSSATIYNLVCQRKIPNSKKGKRLFFSRAELIDWVNSGKRQIEPTI